jgi:flagellar biosynthesis protein FlhB
MSEKTEQPTARRLRRARDEGDSGASPYATQAVAFLVAVVLAPAAGVATAERTSLDLRAAMKTVVPPGAIPRLDPFRLAVEIIGLTAPLLAAVGLAVAIVHAAQTSGVVSPRRLAPTMGRLHPGAGLKALFSGVRVFSVVRSLVAALAVGVLASRALREHISEWARLSGRLAGVVPAISASARSLALQAGCVGLVLGAIDLVFMRHAWLRRLRMTKEEVRREHRDAEGDPQTKSARERAYQEMLAQATVANVRSASVVVVNPTHLACALRYDTRQGDEAPVVTAKGEGSLAARIARAAHDCSVPLVRDVGLARALVEVELGDAIPEALYEAVAGILGEIGLAG